MQRARGVGKIATLFERDIYLPKGTKIGLDPGARRGLDRTNETARQNDLAGLDALSVLTHTAGQPNNTLYRIV